MRSAKDPRTLIDVNLPEQTTSFYNVKEKFEINVYKKECLING